MTGLIAAAQPEPESDISNSAFFPEISPGECRAVLRLDDNIPNARLRSALINGMINVNRNLSTWVTTQLGAGHAYIEAVNDEFIDEQHILSQQYRMAVYYHAKAALLDQYRDYDTTNSGSERADDKEATADEYRRQSILAIRNILGTAHTTVELI